jgi:hypothetical protein
VVPDDCLMKFLMNQGWSNLHKICRYLLGSLELSGKVHTPTQSLSGSFHPGWM